jgi:hypothetical protein
MLLFELLERAQKLAMPQGVLLTRSSAGQSGCGVVQRNLQPTAAALAQLTDREVV